MRQRATNLNLVHRFSMGELAPCERLPIWGERVWSVAGGLGTRTFDSQLLEAQAGSLGPLRLLHLRVGQHPLESRKAALIERCDPGLLEIVFPLRGSLFLRQKGIEWMLHPGQWGVYDTAEPYVAAVGEEVELLVVLIPRSALDRKQVDPGRRPATPFEVAGGVSQVLFRSLTTAMEEMEAVDGAAAESLGLYLMDLIALALSEKLTLAEKSPCARGGSVTKREKLRERIVRYISRHIADPELSIERIAAAFACSKRNLHKVFTDQGRTLNGYIWNLRLEHCAADLARVENVRRAITEVAFRWGFNHTAHFSRAFKERFGMTAREWRARHCGSPAPVAAWRQAREGLELC